MPNESMQDQVTTAQRVNPPISSQDWASVAKDSVVKLTPADKGWILAFVILFSVMQVTNYLTSVGRSEMELDKGQRINAYLELLESNRRDMAMKRADEMRRMQELLKALADTISRQSDRVPRANEQIQKAAPTIIQEAK